MKEKKIQNLSEQQFLKHYQETKKDKYEKPSVTTDMVLFTVATEKVEDKRKKPDMSLQVLLIKRGEHPYKNKWALAGGFMRMDEDADTAAQRELKEETGLDGVYAEQLYTWSAVERDPRMRIVSISYMALVNQERLSPLRAGDDATDVEWFTVTDKVVKTTDEHTTNQMVRTEEIELTFSTEQVTFKTMLEKTTTTAGTNIQTKVKIVEQGELAFDHAEIILYSLERLRGKINYTNIAFNLMDEEFTLPDLQQVYEVILGKPLNKVQFRRHVEKMVIETGNVVKTGAYRPSKLYKYNIGWVYDQWDE